MMSHFSMFDKKIFAIFCKYYTYISWEYIHGFLNRQIFNYYRDKHHLIKMFLISFYKREYYKLCSMLNKILYFDWHTWL